MVRPFRKLTDTVVISSSRPDPVPGAILELPLLTEILSVELPGANEAPQMQQKRPAKKQAQETPLVRLFCARSNPDLFLIRTWSAI